MSLSTGVPPQQLVEGGTSQSWSDLEIDIMIEWQRIKTDLCPGCGRLLSQHSYNEALGRAETVEDYTPWSLECPAAQAIAHGQEMWRKANKSAIDAHFKGNSADPAAGVLWLAQAVNERLPAHLDSDN